MDKLVQTYRRFESDEVPGVKTEIDFAREQHHVITDEEGYFYLQAEKVPSVRGNQSWKLGMMRIVDRSNVSAEESMKSARILTPPGTARVGNIFNITKTFFYTGITNLVTTATLTFWRNAQSREC